VVIRIKNWSQFQHFKDRRPPWVKLYRDLLDDKEWHKLDPKSAKLLVMLWLIASENDGILPDTGTIAWRFRVSEKAVLDAIPELSHWLEHDDNEVISSGYQDGDELASGAYIETETEKRQIGVRNSFVLPDWVPREQWDGYTEARKQMRKPLTDRAKKLLLAELTKLRDEGHDPATLLDTATAKNWLSVYPPKGGERSRGGVAL
jgi:hypothetical protein